MSVKDGYPYITFANRQERFGFSLDGTAGGGEKANMTFEQFRSQIMETYNKAVG